MVAMLPVIGAVVGGLLAWYIGYRFGRARGHYGGWHLGYSKGIHDGSRIGEHRTLRLLPHGATTLRGAEYFKRAVYRRLRALDTRETDLAASMVLRMDAEDAIMNELEIDENPILEESEEKR